MKAISKLPLRISFLALLTFLFTSYSAMAFNLVCPDDVYVNCGEDLYDLSEYGQAEYHDYTGWHDAGNPTVVYDLNHCDQGEITRTWSIWNPYDETYWTCSQIIHVGGSNFNSNQITWPLSGLEVSGCNPDLSPNALPPGYQTPSWTAGTCAMIGSSYTDKIFYFSGACKKIVRTWEVINCCDFNPYTGKGIFLFNQEIDVTISDVPQVTCPADVSASSYDCNGVYVEVPGIVVPDTECSEFVTIMNNSPYASSGGADASGTYPIGTTTITFTADYGCWEKTMCQVDITVTDETAPTPYCLYGLSIALMGIDADDDGTNEDGMVEIWASDLDQGSFASCSSNSALSFSFSSDINDNVRMFTCEDVGRNDLEIWVTDEYGRQNYCNTYVRVQNNAANIPDCEDSDDYSNISGTAEAHYGGEMDDMQIKAIATSHEGNSTFVEVMTIVETVVDSFLNADESMVYVLQFDSVWITEEIITYPTLNHFTNLNYGSYMLEDMHHYNDYQIFGNGSDMNNELIDLADVALLQLYIEGETELTAYQKLAADVNKDGTIDEFDVDVLMTVINGNEPNDFDKLWHFFDKGMDMENMTDDHDCEEFCRVLDLQEDIYKVNLIGYRIGDLTKDKMAESSDNDNNVQSIRQRSADIKDIKVKISPNPFISAITLETSSKVSYVTQFIVKNEFGQLILSKDITIESGTNQQSLEVNLDCSGIYIYEIQIGSELKTGKLVKI